MRRKQNKKNKLVVWLLGFLAVVAVAVAGAFALQGGKKATSTNATTTQTTQTTETQSTYQPSQEEKDYLAQKFAGLSATNSDTIAYLYAPGTKLDEPVVQTTDNATYLDKTFEGGHEPYMGTVFMDMDNSKTFSDSLTWLFGHARGSKVPDNRMFNDVNFYDDQTFFNEHPYIVVETPERTYYYEAAFLIIVPEDTAFYRTSFDSKKQFKEQLQAVSEMAHTKSASITINEDDKYLVLSTCREEDDTIRSNLYCRLIPDSEMEAFLAKNKDSLAYQPTR